MEIAKVTSKGQVTIPKELRDELNIETGTKLLFYKRGQELVARTLDPAPRRAGGSTVRETEGFYSVSEESIDALEALQEAFSGIAEASGWESEEDVAEFIRQNRRANTE